MIPSAELRLYQPLHAFPAEERESWERWLVAGGHLAARTYRDLPTGPGLGIVAGSGDGARVLLEDGTMFVSPDRTRMQVLAGMLATREDDDFGRRVVSAAQARRAKRELRRLRRRHPGRTPSVMTSPWSVPARWFLLFDDDERRLASTPRLSLTYRTTARRALGRLESTIPILRGSHLPEAAERLIDLYRWIGNVHPRSVVRLDYGGLCDLLRWDELDDDHGAADVRDAIEELSVGRFAASGEIYRSVEARHADLRGRVSLN
ncbi:MAG: hypothetical protein ACKO8G_01550 [Actinomycetota bacterium]